MFDKTKYKSTIGFTDMLFNILVGFAFLFIVAFLLIKPEAKKHDFERKAEFVVIMEWDHDQADDIDLYVQDPTNARVSFRMPIANFMHLDKDDLGLVNDIVKNVDGSISKVNINREVVSIRSIIPGEYVINAHYYARKVMQSMLNFKNERVIVGVHDKSSQHRLLTVKIELHKVNPYTILWVGEKKFFRKGQEETFVRFTIDKKGDLIGNFSYEKINFVVPKMIGYEPSSSPSISPENDIIEDEPPGQR